MMKHKRVAALLMAGVMVLSNGVMPIADEWIDVEEELVGVGVDFGELAEEEFFEDDQVVFDDQLDGTGVDDVLVDESADDSYFDEELFDDEYLESTTENGNELYDDLVINDEEGMDEELQVSADDPEIVHSGTCGSNVTWKLDNEGNMVICGSGGMENYDTEYNKAPWYYYRSDIKTIIIESGVTSIGRVAFNNCSSLKSITIPDGVTSIGRKAFQNCSKLMSIMIPNSVTSIEEEAFLNCSGLTSITISDSVASIENYTFYNCSSLKSITIPDGVTSIEFSAFCRCSNLTSVMIPDSVTYIGYTAFSECSSLTSIVIPDSVTSIGDYTFNNCGSLTSITIPANVTSIEDSTFEGCDNLTIYANHDSYAATFASNHDIPLFYIHIYGDWITKTAATCTTDGERTHKCTGCDAEESDIIPATGHIPVTDPAIAPTTTSEGKTEGSHCSVCGAILEPQQTIAMIEASEQITVTKKPTIQKPATTKNKITVKWKHFKHTSKKTKKIWKKIKKVQIQCATDKGFTNIVKTVMSGKNKTSVTVKGLQKNTTYFVRVRYYDGTGYSKWSSVKKIKTKKK